MISWCSFRSVGGGLLEASKVFLAKHIFRKPPADHNQVQTGEFESLTHRMVLLDHLKGSHRGVGLSLSYSFFIAVYEPFATWTADLVIDLRIHRFCRRRFAHNICFLGVNVG